MPEGEGCRALGVGILSIVLVASLGTYLLLLGGSDNRGDADKIVLEATLLPTTCRMWRGGFCVARVGDNGMDLLQQVVGKRPAGIGGGDESISALERKYYALKRVNAKLQSELLSKEREEASVAALESEYLSLTEKNAMLEAKLSSVDRLRKEHTRIAMLADSLATDDMNQIEEGASSQVRLTGAMKPEERESTGWGFPTDEMRMFSTTQDNAPEASSPTSAASSNSTSSGKSGKLCWFWCGHVTTGSSEAAPYYGTLAQSASPSARAMNASGANESSGSLKLEDEDADQQTPDDFLKKHGNGYQDEFGSSVEAERVVKATRSAVATAGGGDGARQRLQDKIQRFVSAFGDASNVGGASNVGDAANVGDANEGDVANGSPTPQQQQRQPLDDHSRDNLGGAPPGGPEQSDDTWKKSIHVQSVDSGSIVPCGWPRPPCGGADGEPQGGWGDAGDALKARVHHGGAVLAGKLSLNAMLQQPLEFGAKRDETDDADEPQPLLRR